MLFSAFHYSSVYRRRVECLQPGADMKRWFDLDIQRRQGEVEAGCRGLHHPSGLIHQISCAHVRTGTHTQPHTHARLSSAFKLCSTFRNLCLSHCRVHKRWPSCAIWPLAAENGVFLFVQKSSKAKYSVFFFRASEIIPSQTEPKHSWLQPLHRARLSGRVLCCYIQAAVSSGCCSFPV